MKYFLVILIVLIQACGPQTYVVDSNVSEPTPTVTVTSTPIPNVLTKDEKLLEDVKELVWDENDYRDGLGQTQLTQGLSCTLYTITGGQYILNDVSHTPTLTGVSQVATFTHKEGFDQGNSNNSDGLAILPQALRNNPTYKNLIKVTCQGQLVITQTGYHKFDLSSDDGSVLTVAGTRVVDNDGNHGYTAKSGSKYLRRGVHTFKLDYAQSGGGNLGLSLVMDDYILSSIFLFH